ncbi:MAG: hypothetical protein CL524_06255 [Aequorivita sp.]|nr:hypothetical protein [Aequorivita sp.]MBF31800.1 hypothetical protein [Aequorivita sp.]
MREIGGYFGLELNTGKEFHDNAIRLNTGRNALEYILKANGFSKIYLPFFICDAVLQPIKKHNIDVIFYTIDEQLEPVFNYETIEEKSAFLYVNYFGLKDLFVQTLPAKCKNLIIDNSQSFFSKPLPGTDTFYSARKFFGVPDGAYLYSNRKLDSTFERDESFERASHLLKRVDVDAETGFNDFRNNEAKLENQEIKQMSSLSKALLSGIDYQNAIQRRTENFDHLHASLKKLNKFKVKRGLGVPMVYPFWNSNSDLKKTLLAQKIYTPTYWENVKAWVEEESLEYKIVDEVVYLPIDQRYIVVDMDIILKSVQ